MNIIEKLAWMIVPMLLSAVTYLWATVQTTKEKLQQLEVSSELARERMRGDILSQAVANRERISVLEEKVSKLEGKK